MKEIIIGIYKITSPTKRIYIGQSVNIYKRFKQYEKLDCKMQIRLYNSLIKYGYKNHKFEIIDVCDINSLNNKEQYYQELFNCIGQHGLNCRVTSSNDRTGYFSDETRNKLSKANIGNKNGKGNKGIVPSNSTRENLRIKNTGKKHSIETCAKIRLSLLGNTHALGYRFPDEIKAKMSSDRIGIKRSAEHIKKVADAHRKIILDITTGIYFFGSKEAANAYNINADYLRQKLNGNRKNNTNLIYA
jgi:group I intron endonuclease